MGLFMRFSFFTTAAYLVSWFCLIYLWTQRGGTVSRRKHDTKRTVERQNVLCTPDVPCLRPGATSGNLWESGNGDICISLVWAHMGYKLENFQNKQWLTPPDNEQCYCRSTRTLRKPHLSQHPCLRNVSRTLFHNIFWFRLC